jgi:hypothetical protein
MEGPEESDEEGEKVGQVFDLPSDARGGRGRVADPPDRAPQEADEHKRARDMKGEVECVVAPRVFAADGVVEGEREIDERAAGGRAAVGGRVERAERPEFFDRGVAEDGGGVVEDEKGRGGWASKR